MENTRSWFSTCMCEYFYYEKANSEIILFNEKSLNPYAI